VAGTLLTDDQLPHSQRIFCISAVRAAQFVDAIHVLLVLGRL